ncbi:hypothetical protein KIPB_004342 [Kipferlia bialata]|uniref:Glucosamine 6-phosphate N-acetyltransferase n=1 Tax=Kipferlia bialata TaxID=797122 RepID=A0A9K3CUD8_9EUKA|nr:hypothetical protein KIPB_004342 [Kipferlia bialata]|eukprot:g4342.t1
MSPSDDAVVSTACWDEEGDTLQNVRRIVFILGQSVPEEREIDGLDPSFIHVKVTVGGEVVGTARMNPQDGHIGRVAVLAGYRGRGLGCMLMQELHRQAHALGLDHTHLSAQLTSEAFYSSLGYVRANDRVFLDAGMEHVDMHRRV